MNGKKGFLAVVILPLLSSIVGLVQISVLQMAMISLHRKIAASITTTLRQQSLV